MSVQFFDVDFASKITRKMVPAIEATCDALRPAKTKSRHAMHTMSGFLKKTSSNGTAPNLPELAAGPHTKFDGTSDLPKLSTPEVLDIASKQQQPSVMSKESSSDIKLIYDAWALDDFEFPAVSGSDMPAMMQFTDPRRKL